LPTAVGSAFLIPTVYLTAAVKTVASRPTFSYLVYTPYQPSVTTLRYAAFTYTPVHVRTLPTVVAFAFWVYAASIGAQRSPPAITAVYRAFPGGVTTGSLPHYLHRAVRTLVDLTLINRQAKRGGVTVGDHVSANPHLTAWWNGLG